MSSADQFPAIELGLFDSRSRECAWARVSELSSGKGFHKWNRRFIFYPNWMSLITPSFGVRRAVSG